MPVGAPHTLGSLPFCLSLSWVSSSISRQWLLHLYQYTRSLASVSVLHILLLFNKSIWILHRQLKANLPKTETHQLACLHIDFQFQAIVSPDWTHLVSKDARLENETQLSSSFSNSAKSQNLLDSLPLHYLYCLGAGSYPSHLDIWTNLIPSSGILHQTSIPKPPLRESF